MTSNILPLMAAAVVDANNQVEQAHDYTVSGVPATRLGQTVDHHLHTGKPWQGFNGLGWYDNRARVLDALTGRFTTPDPLAEKYPWESPYAHCAGNPVKFIDPTGMDYTPIIDHNNKTITFRAAFYCYTSTNDETINEAIDTWNNNTGHFLYETKSGIEYTVVFDLIKGSEITDSEVASNVISYLPDDDNHFVSRLTQNDMIVSPQGVSDGFTIAIKKSLVNNSGVLSHEIGHNMGLSHANSGLMHSEAGGEGIIKDNVKTLLMNIGVIGKPRTTNARIINYKEIGTEPDNFKYGNIIEN